MVDDHIRRRGLDAPPAEPDATDGPVELDPPTALDLRAESIGSVVCGAPVRRRLLLPGPALLDADGQPRRQDAAAAAPGVFYLGLQWLIRRACGILHGFSRDAATVADAIRAYLDN